MMLALPDFMPDTMAELRLDFTKLRFPCAERASVHRLITLNNHLAEDHLHNALSAVAQRSISLCQVVNVLLFRR